MFICDSNSGYTLIIQSDVSKPKIQAPKVAIDYLDALEKKLRADANDREKTEIFTWVNTEIAPQAPGFVQQVQLVDSILKGDETKVIQWLKEVKETHTQLNLGKLGKILLYDR